MASATDFPSSGNYRILIDSEILYVTGGQGTTTWTVARGQEGTTAATHGNGTPVTCILTKGALDQFRSDNMSTGSYSAIPTAGRVGRIYLPNDVPVIWFDNGTNWVPLLSSAGGILLCPDSQINLGSFAWVNQGSGTATGKNGTVDFKAGANSSDSIRLLKKAVPTAPYKVEVGLLPFYGLGGGFYMSGLALRESSTGKLRIFSFMGDTPGLVSQISVDSYVNPTTYNAAISRNKAPNGWPPFMRIFDDNTDVNYQVSWDRQSWFTIKNEPRGTYFTADEIGFCLNNTNTGFDIRALFSHWIEY